MNPFSSIAHWLQRARRRNDSSDRELRDALTRSERRYQNLVERNPAPMFRATVSGRILECNDAFARLLGYDSRAELMSLPIATIYPDPSVRTRLVEELREKGSITNREVTLQRKDGSRVFTLFHTILSADEETGEDAVEGTLIDVTPQHEILDRLRETEQRFNFLVRATEDAVYDWNIETGYLNWNEGWGTLLGYPPDAVSPDLTWWENKLHPDERNRIVASLNAAVDQQEPYWAEEYRFRRADGGWAWVLDRGYFVRDESGRAVRMIGALQDLTSRRAEEEVLRESESLFRALIENASDGIIVVDPDGVIRYASPSMEKLLGRPPEDLIGMQSNDLVHPEDRVRAAIGLTSRIHVPDSMFSLTYRLRHKDGSWRSMEAVASNLPAGRLSGAVVNLRDLTERRALERQLEQANHLSRLGRLAATIAHEFNNVLMGIQPFAELIRRTRDENVLESATTRILESVQRGKYIAQGILRYTRPTEPTLQAIDLRAWMKTLRAELDAVVGTRVDLDVQVVEEPLFVLGDPLQMVQTLVNLAINARDAMPEGGTLTITAEEALSWRDFSFGVVPTPDRFIHFSVHDTGTGIAPEHIEHIFEPLYSTKKSSGTGLGLNVANQIVSAHGGQMFVESEVGVGTTFHIFIPRTYPEIHQELESRG
jgi:two-component system, cell cycle sensor histidine kinase and response regulator CckA